MNVECIQCAAIHPSGPHIYDFVDDVDDDLCCPICLSPFLNPTDLPCCHTFCRACVLPYLRKSPNCPQDRKIAQVADCHDSSLALKRICDKLNIKCPKCNYVTERCLLGDHLQKCPSNNILNGRNPTKIKLRDGGGATKDRPGRSRSRDRLNNNGGPRNQPRWRASRDRLGARSRSRDTVEDDRTHHRSNDRLDSRSTENLTEMDFTSEIERDIERINLMQEQSNGTSAISRQRPVQRLVQSEESTEPNNNHHTAPTHSRSVHDRVHHGSADNLDRLNSRSTPNLNDAVLHDNSDSSSNTSNYQNIVIQASSSPGRPDRVLDLRIPVAEQSGDCGIAIVGGSDTPLRGIFIQSLLPESPSARVGILKPGDRVLKLNGRTMDGLNHSEAVIIFSKLTQQAFNRDKRELSMSIVRQVGYEVDERHTFVIRKDVGQQVGVKLYNVLDRVSIYEVVPGSLAWRDRRLNIGDQLLKVGSTKVRNSEEAAREISKVKAETQISLTVTRTMKSQHPEADRPHLVIPDPHSVRHTSTIPSKVREKCIVIRKQLGESLGLGIAGGLGSLLGDLPVFVLEVSRTGVLSRDGRIKAGDLLISVNGKSISGLRHSQVVEILKEVARKEREIKIVLSEFEYRHRDREDKASNRPGRSWAPTWRHWLALPPRFIIYRETTIKRQEINGLGLSIVGGGGEPVLVKFCTPGGAAMASHLRSGDEILSVNGKPIRLLGQEEIRAQLSVSSVRITFISWPGCLV